MWGVTEQLGVGVDGVRIHVRKVVVKELIQGIFWFVFHGVGEEE